VVFWPGLAWPEVALASPKLSLMAWLQLGLAQAPAFVCQNEFSCKVNYMYQQHMQDRNTVWYIREQTSGGDGEVVILVAESSQEEYSYQLEASTIHCAGDDWSGFIYSISDLPG